MFANAVKRAFQGPYDADDIVNGNVSFPDLPGCYVLSNLVNGKAYVGKSEHPNKRVVNHFTGRGGHPDVYYDYRNGDKFSVNWITLADTNMPSLSVLESSLILVFNSIRRGYNDMLSNSRCASENEVNYVRGQNTVVDFWMEFEDSFVWDLLPNTFLYDLYKAWYRKNNLSGQLVRSNKFKKQIHVLAEATGLWCKTNGAMKRSIRMDKPEPLIAKYNLRDWMDEKYSGTDVDKQCIPPKDIVSYNGLVRIC